MNRESFAFVVYMIHACANKWRKMPSEVYKLLQKTGCIDNYLVPHYDILHTQGTAYVVVDTREYLGIRRVEVKSPSEHEQIIQPDFVPAGQTFGKFYPLDH